MLENYNIPFASLKYGNYLYDYLIEHPFFEMFEYSPITEGRVWVNLLLSKQSSSLLLLNFTIKGTVEVQCDRCLEKFDFPLEGKNKLLVKLDDTLGEESEEIIVISKKEDELNIAQYIYEFINLLIPFKVVHPEDENGHSRCNKKILAVLKKLHPKPHKKNVVDPRWETLKKLYP